MAFGSGGRRSIQLSYGRVNGLAILSTCDRGCVTDHTARNGWRARQDSNLRPTDSKSGALSN